MIQYPDAFNGAWQHHHLAAAQRLVTEAKQKGVDTFDKFQEWWKTKADPTTNLVSMAPPLPIHMITGYSAVPKAMGYKEGKYGELKIVQGNKKHKDKPTWKQTLRKSLEDLSVNELQTLVKSYLESDK